MTQEPYPTTDGIIVDHEIAPDDMHQKTIRATVKMLKMTRGDWIKVQDAALDIARACTIRGNLDA